MGHLAGMQLDLTFLPMNRKWSNDNFGGANQDNPVANMGSELERYGR